jgi:hypothetical protein
LGKFSTGTGNASVDWTVSNSLLQTYYRNNNGAWTTLTKAQAFSLTTGTLDVLFVGNENTDSDSDLSNVTVTAPNVSVPEPSSVMGLVSLGLLGLRQIHSRKKS